MKDLLIFFSLLIFLGSCTIEKRLHYPGYNIQWNNMSRKSFDKSNLETEPRNGEIRLLESPDLEQEFSSQVINQTIDSTFQAQTSSEIQIEKVAMKIVTHKIHQSFSNKTTNNNDLKKLNSSPVQQKEDAKLKRDVDWELLGNIGAGILILVVLGFALFGSGTLASIAAILIAIGYVVITIAAIVCICWFLWFIFFGWWLR